MGRRTWDSLPDRFRPLPGRRQRRRHAQLRLERAGSRARRVARRGSAAARRRGARVRDRRRARSTRPPFRSPTSSCSPRSTLDVDGDTFFPEWDRSEFEETSPRGARRPRTARRSPSSRTDARTRRAPARRRSPMSPLSSSEAGIAYWLFGGWAVDFYAGRITRPHVDVDIAVWLDDVPRIAALLDGERLAARARAGRGRRHGVRARRRAARADVSRPPRRRPRRHARCATSTRRGPTVRSAPTSASSTASRTRASRARRARRTASRRRATIAGAAAKDAADFDVLSGL